MTKVFSLNSNQKEEVNFCLQNYEILNWNFLCLQTKLCKTGFFFTLHLGIISGFRPKRTPRYKNPVAPDGVTTKNYTNNRKNGYFSSLFCK